MSHRAPSALPPPLRAVTFDCWSTLLLERDWSVAHALRVDALSEAAKRAGRESDRAELSGVFDAAWNRHIARWTSGVGSGAAEVARDAFGILGLSEESAGFAALVTSWEEASHSGVVEAVEGTHAHLAFLSRAGVRLGVICDTGLTPGRVVRRLLHNVGLLTYFDVCVFSDEVGMVTARSADLSRGTRSAGSRRRAALTSEICCAPTSRERGVGMASIRIRAVYDDRAIGEAGLSPTPTPNCGRSSNAHSADAVFGGYRRIARGGCELLPLVCQVRLVGRGTHERPPWPRLRVESSEHGLTR